MQNRYVSTVGHPTGWLIGEREPSVLDMERIIATARELGCDLDEPERLDLNDVHAHAAKEADIKLAISTDAHAVNAFRSSCTACLCPNRAKCRPIRLPT